MALDVFATTYYSQSNGNFYSDAIWATTETESNSSNWVKAENISTPSNHDFVIQHNVTLPNVSISVGSIVIESGKYLYHLASGTAGQATLSVTNLSVVGILYIRNNYVNLTVENIFFLEGSHLNLTESVANITHNGMFYSNSVTTLTLDLASPVVSGLLGDYISGSISADNTLRYPSASTENTLSSLPSAFLSETGSITLKKDYTLKISTAIPNTFTISAGSGSNASDNGSIEFLSGASGTFMPANDGNPFLNFIMNTSSGITLGRGVNIGGELTLTDGVITTNGNTLAIKTGGSVKNASYTNDINTTISGGSNASYVDGQMSMEVTGTNNYVLLPVGDNNLLRVGGAKSLVSPSPSDYTLFVKHVQSIPTNNTELNDIALKVSGSEYWEIEVTGSDVDNVNERYNVILSYHTTSGVNTSSLNTVHLMHYRGAKWYSEGSMAGDGTHTTDTNNYNESVEGFIEAPTATFSPFTLGGDSNHDLPITLKSFEVERKEDELLFRWITAQEVDNDYFKLEGSSDKKHSKVLAKIEGAGNSNVEIKYAHTLSKEQWNKYQFFRLKQTDFDGKYSYSSWIHVEHNETPNKFDYIIYPNPSSLAINVKMTALANETIKTYQIFDLNGKRYHSTSWNPTHHTIDISSLPKGIYMLMISTLSGKKKIQRFTVQ
ncbi:hypothetical protein AVL50_02860 [Flammeovirga sp. SJP92]|nr:hypothetical protein AVL50_02860 [Flammeovirga sp. SJP92]